MTIQLKPQPPTKVLFAKNEIILGQLRWQKKCENKHKKALKGHKRKREWESHSAFYLTFADFFSQMGLCFKAEECMIFRTQEGSGGIERKTKETDISHQGSM